MPDGPSSSRLPPSVIVPVMPPPWRLFGSVTSATARRSALSAVTAA